MKLYIIAITCMLAFLASSQDCGGATCTTGQYCDAGTTTCMSCVTNCDTCTNGTVCEGCSTGYDWNNGTLACELRVCNCTLGQFCDETTQICGNCLANCENCTDSTTCLVCNDGFNWDNTACITCGEGMFFNLVTLVCEDCQNNCTECISNSTCETCKNGTFYNFSQLNQNGTCDDCIENCDICTNDTICEICNPSTPIFNETNQCDVDKNCPEGQYFNDDVYACNDCMGLCSTCQNSTTCDECMPGHWYQNVENQTIECKPCFTDCMTCTNDTNCQMCNNGTWLNNVTTTCDACSTNCTSCGSLDDCSSCSGDNHVENVTNPDTNETREVCMPNECPPTEFWEDNGCKDCLFGCEVCNNTESCDQCLPPEQIMQCQWGQFYNEFDQGCSSCNVKHCKTCGGKDNCTECVTGYSLNEGQCTYNANGACADGQYFINDTCEGCSGSCQHCSSNGTCEQCYDGKDWLNNNETCGFYCETNCVDGQRGCFSCNNETEVCASCLTGYRWNAFAKECQKLDPTIICPPVDYHYFWFNETEQLCKECSLTCKGCDNGSFNCTGCAQDLNLEYNQTTQIYECVNSTTTLLYNIYQQAIDFLM